MLKVHSKFNEYYNEKKEFQQKLKIYQKYEKILKYKYVNMFNMEQLNKFKKYIKGD